MQLTLLKGKIHRATVTQCDLHYEGSISVDAALLERSGILPNDLPSLSGWVSNPQALKPGSLMPATGLSAADLNAVVAYLRTLT